MLVYNGMLMGTGTVYKHLAATRSEREGAHTEHHMCPSGTRTRTQLFLHGPPEYTKTNRAELETGWGWGREVVGT